MTLPTYINGFVMNWVDMSQSL